MFGTSQRLRTWTSSRASGAKVPYPAALLDPYILHTTDRSTRLDSAFVQPGARHVAVAVGEEANRMADLKRPGLACHASLRQALCDKDVARRTLDWHCGRIDRCLGATSDPNDWLDVCQAALID